MNPVATIPVLLSVMADWLKILISALAGMMTGILGGIAVEPLKQWVTRKTAARRGRTAIYKEIAAMWGGFNLCAERCEDLFAPSAAHRTEQIAPHTLPARVIDQAPSGAT